MKGMVCDRCGGIAALEDEVAGSVLISISETDDDDNMTIVRHANMDVCSACKEALVTMFDGRVATAKTNPAAIKTAAIIPDGVVVSEDAPEEDADVPEE